MSNAKKLSKKIVLSLLTVLMLFSSVPTAVFAEGEDVVDTTVVTDGTTVTDSSQSTFLINSRLQRTLIVLWTYKIQTLIHQTKESASMMETEMFILSIPKQCQDKILTTN